MTSTKGLRVRLGPIDGMENSSSNISRTSEGTRSERGAGVASASGRSMESAYKFPASRLKTDQFFLQWLAQPDNQELVWQLVEDSKAGKVLKGPSSSVGTPRSPRHHAPVVQSPTPSGTTPPLSPSKGSSPKSVMSPTKPSTTGLQPLESNGKASSTQIPHFYFPQAHKATQEQRDAFAAAVRRAFQPHGGSVTAVQLQSILPDLCNCPGYLASVLVPRIAGPNNTLSEAAFIAWWNERRLVDADANTCVFEALRQPANDCLVKQDFQELMQFVLKHHPGLEFLQETAEFQDRYAETVILRIFYSLDRSGRGKVTLRDLKRSDFTEALARLDTEEDINKVLKYFSYEHFYVIYCKFWELDMDHDFMIDREDLLRYGNHGLTYRIVDRIFSGAPRPLSCTTPGKMGYEDFVYFILSEEDKSTDTSLAYWHHCIDLDADGTINVHDMRFFYEEQLHRIECASQVPVSFNDIMCQINDMVSPEEPDKFTLRDLRRQRALAGTMFNILFNLPKFVAFEMRDPFVVRQETNEDPDASEWDRYARQEYIRLALEEENADDMQLEDSVPLWDESIGHVQLSPGNSAPNAEEGTHEGMETTNESPVSDPIGTPSVWS